MRKAIIAGLMGLGLSGAVLLAEQAASSTAPAAPTTQQAAAVNKNCPINTTEAVDPKVTVTYKGKVYAFCCKECIATFNKDPEKYKDAK